ncbi:unnamed protein product [Anisakis simplex]|uniref:General transcription factor IIH subunit 3 n=1 Tax=Anisakis simplex TaxID=6269 RepID=A0A0M3K6K4_ANISI|nr:unnamed protein product [Anisakis simplex]
MTKTIVERLRNTLLKSSENSENTPNIKTNRFSAAVATAFCHINRFKKENDGGEGRIVIVNVGYDVSREQNSLMNIFFSAHKQNIVVSVADIGNSSPVLQQACDITAGRYFKVDKPSNLLQYLMCNALHSSENVSIFKPALDTSVDYRALCQCHAKPVLIGYVCSVCLSVQCKFNPICPMCKLVFDFFNK